MKNFWQQLKNSAPSHKAGRQGGQAIYALAPMAGITDSAFRQICKGFGADVVYSEMASVTALFYNPRKTLEMLQFSEKEAPYVVQLFGSNPKHFSQAVKLLTDKKQISKLSPPLRDPAHNKFYNKVAGQISNYKLPQGIDINFGCPVKKVQKQGAGAVLMNDLKLSREIIKTVIDNTDLPVSIKTRSKVGKISVLDFLKNVEDLDIKAIMIHGRTLAQGFSGPVDTEIIKKARNYFNGIILANGGINSYDDAVQILDQTEADGVGIARGALGSPWIFEYANLRLPDSLASRQAGQKTPKNACPIALHQGRRAKEIFTIALSHAKLAEKLKGKQGIIEMRKHLCWYVHGLPGAREMRQKLVKVENKKSIKEVFKKFC